MKQRKFIELFRMALATVAAVGLFGVALLVVNQLTLQAATNGEASFPPAVDYVSIPDNPVPEGAQALDVTLVNITSEDVEIPQNALSLEEAALVSAQYIYDIFGASIDGMYIEFEYTDWEHVTRTLWFGVVSNVYRNSIVRNQRARELHDEFMARIEAGEDSEAIAAEWDLMMYNYQYVPGYFYLFIDAVTGERIEIWRQTESDGAWTREESAIIEAYIEREWGGSWGLPSFDDADPAVLAEFTPIVTQYTQRHFNNSTVADVEFNGKSTILRVVNNEVTHITQLNFLVTDDTGRVASVRVCKDSRQVIAISTLRNDMIPRIMESDFIDGDWGDWEEYKYEMEDGSIVIRRRRVISEDGSEYYSIEVGREAQEN